MTLLRSFVAMAALIFFFAPQAQAQGPGMSMQDFKHVPLTRDMVANFVASMPAMKAFSQKNKLDKPPRTKGAGPFADFVKYLEQRNLKGEANALLGKYGFSDIRQWMRVSQSVMMAHGFSRSGKTPAQMKTEMRAMIDKITNDPRLPADQKSVLKQRFQAQMEMTLKMIPPAANIEAVREFGPKLDAQLGRK